MREFFEIITGSTDVFGYVVPMVTLIALALIAVTFLFRIAWPSILGGLLLFVMYFLPRP